MESVSGDTHSDPLLDIRSGLNTIGLLRLLKDAVRKLNPPPPTNQVKNVASVLRDLGSCPQVPFTMDVSWRSLYLTRVTSKFSKEAHTILVSTPGTWWKRSKDVRSVPFDCAASRASDFSLKLLLVSAAGGVLRPSEQLAYQMDAITMVSHDFEKQFFAAIVVFRSPEKSESQGNGWKLWKRGSGKRHYGWWW